MGKLLSVFTISGSDKGAAGFSASARLLPQSAKVVRPETSQMIIYDPRQMKGICMEEFYSIPKSSRLSSFLVTDKQDPIHFCVLDIFSHFICSLGRGRGRGIQFVE